MGRRSIADCRHNHPVVQPQRQQLFSTSFPELTEACSTALKGRAAILDGEVIVLDRHTRPNFDLLRRRLNASKSAPALAVRLPATMIVFCV